MKNFLKDVGPVRHLRGWNERRVKSRRAERLQRRLSDPRNSIGVLAIMKNESWNIQEWLDHYSNEGVQNFFLVDNGSTDNTVELARKWNGPGTVEVLLRPDSHRQRQHYWSAFQELQIQRKCQWLLVADLDEFWFVKDGQSLAQVMPYYDDVDLVYVNWSVFGASGHVAHPKSLRTELVHRWPARGRHDIRKWMCRTDLVRNADTMDVHCVKHFPSERTISDNVNLQINHYVIQSQDFWRQIKMTRGDAADLTRDQRRNMDEFWSTDQACTIEDRTLADRLIGQP